MDTEVLIQGANDACAACPGAVQERPFGPTTAAWKVGGKIFALINDDGDGPILKCQDQETADFLKDIGIARTAPYLKRGGWVQILWENVAAGAIEPEDLADRLRVSHAMVCKSLPKRLRPDLPSS